MKIFKIIQPAIYLLLLLLPFSTLKAQETSTGINGSVTDTAKLAVPRAVITVIHIPSGTKYTTITGTNGRYGVPGIRVGGPYSVTVNSAGMQMQEQLIAQIRLGEPLTLN